MSYQAKIRDLSQSLTFKLQDLSPEQLAIEMDSLRLLRAGDLAAHKRARAKRATTKGPPTAPMSFTNGVINFGAPQAPKPKKLTQRERTIQLMKDAGCSDEMIEKLVPKPRARKSK